MKRFLPVMFALLFSALAVGFTLFVVRPRMTSLKAAGEGLRHKIEEVVEEVVEEMAEKEADR